MCLFFWFLPEVSGCKFGFSQRESCLSHHLSHLSLSLRNRRKIKSLPLENHSDYWRKKYMVFLIENVLKKECRKPTDFYDFAEDLTEAHGEGIGFLFEQVAAGLSPFQPSLHDGLSPASPNKTNMFWMLYFIYIGIRYCIYRGYLHKKNKKKQQ